MASRCRAVSEGLESRRRRTGPLGGQRGLKSNAEVSCKQTHSASLRPAFIAHRRQVTLCSSAAACRRSLPMGPQQLDAYPHMSAVPSQPHLNL